MKAELIAGQYVLKFGEKFNRVLGEGDRASCKLNWRGMKNWRFSTNISLNSTRT